MIRLFECFDCILLSKPLSAQVCFPREFACKLGFLPFYQNWVCRLRQCSKILSTSAAPIVKWVDLCVYAHEGSNEEKRINIKAVTVLIRHTD